MSGGAKPWMDWPFVSPLNGLAEIRAQNPVGPWSVPAPDTSSSLTLVATRTDVPRELWNSKEWEMAARCLASELDALVARHQQTSIELALARIAATKRPRGRPAKAPPGVPLNALMSGRLAAATLHKRPGRPETRKLVELYEAVESAREYLEREHPGKRITDKAAIECGLKYLAKENNYPERWIREMTAKLRKDYSEAKRKIGKLGQNS